MVGLLNRIRSGRLLGRPLKGRVPLTGGAAVPSWVFNRGTVNTPDAQVNFKTGQVWLKAGNKVRTVESLVTSTRSGPVTQRDTSNVYTKFAAATLARSNRGLALWESRTNSIRTSDMTGAIVMADNVELVQNGSFATAANWTQSPGSGTITFTNGNVNFINDAAARISQQITGLVVGKNYVVTIGGPNSFSVAVGTTDGASDLASLSLIGNGAASTTTDRGGFTATGTTAFVSISPGSAASKNLTSISVQDGERVENGTLTQAGGASNGAASNGWVSTRAGTSVMSYPGGGIARMTVDGAGSTLNFQSANAIPTVANCLYTVTYTLAGASPNLAVLRVGSTSGGSDLLNMAPGSTPGTYTFQFVAISTTSYLLFIANVASSVTDLSNISVKSAGKFPNNWKHQLSVSTGNTVGLLHYITGKGTESGIDYIDYRSVGTTSGALSGTVMFLAEQDTQVAATYGQTWSNTQFTYLVGGSYSNIAVSAGAVHNSNVGNGLAAPVVTVNSSTGPLGAPTNRITANGTITVTGAAFINHRALQFTASGGVAVDATFRLGAPQMENNGLTSSVASAVKAADGASGIDGSAVYTVTGGTGTAATLNVTWAAGVMTVNSVAASGTYTVLPPSPATLTYLSGAATGWVGATVTLTPTNNVTNAFPTPWIPTTSAAVSRGVDATTFNMSGYAFGTSFSMVVQATPQGNNYSASPGGVSAVDDNTANNRAGIRMGNGVSTMISASGGVSSSQNSIGTWTIGVSAKSAMADTAGDQRLALMVCCPQHQQPERFLWA
jgi:hypothetical protein